MHWLPSVLILLIAAAVPAQDDTLAARFQMLGTPSVITHDDIALEMARRLRRTEEGQAGLDNLIDLELVRQAARKQGLEPSRREIDEWLPQLAARLRADGLELDAKLRSLGMTRRSFEEYAALQLAQIKLVRAALDLPSNANVDGDMLRLWLAEAHRKTKIVTDESKLPRGVVAEVGGQRVGLLALGQLLARGSKPEVRDRYIERIVRQRCVQALAQSEGIEVTEADLDEEIAARRRLAEANPKLRGLSFEKFLESIGTNLAELRSSAVLQAQIRERKLTDKLYPREELDRRLHDERAAIERRYGEKRRLDVLLVRAEPTRTKEQAKGQAARLLEQIRSGTEFRDAALTHSDDTYTKVGGGDAGWHHREGSRLPDPVLDAGFAAEPSETVGPVQTDVGSYLVRVRAVEPCPSDDALRTRLRDDLHRARILQLLEEAKVEVIR